MDDRLLKRYREYANSEEAFAVLFVKKHLAQAKGHWVDIANCRRYEMSHDSMHFRFVVGGLFKKKINPKYPPRSDYTINGKFDERTYYLMTRAITWETAHTDIEQQKAKRILPIKFEIKGVSYPAMSKRRLRHYLHERLNRYYTRKSQRKCRLYGQKAFEVLVARYGLIDPTKYTGRGVRL